jgi:predicted ATPase
VELLKLQGERKTEIEGFLVDVILEKKYKSIFWTAEDRYLITQPVDLSEFSKKSTTSIPLRNCFLLAGITNIEERINELANDSTEIELLEKELGEKVTEHIKEVWSDHPIVITFKINNGLINFHVKDVGDEGKAKTADQRSDGFKQFISFLLTVSAQGKNKELSDTILLLDEPETHLYPEAQEHLLSEIIRITQNDRRNIAFFATHSIFMIDKKDLSRNYRIIKKLNTFKERFKPGTSTYSSILYKVFGIASTDYHTELYSTLHARYQDADPSDDEREKIRNFDAHYFVIEKFLPKDKPWKGHQNEITLPTYIRNCIDHPDNGNIYTSVELKKSIELLQSYK